jgi:hypothetical protein
MVFTTAPLAKSTSCAQTRLACCDGEFGGAVHMAFWNVGMNAPCTQPTLTSSAHAHASIFPDTCIAAPVKNTSRRARTLKFCLGPSIAADVLCEQIEIEIDKHSKAGAVLLQIFIQTPSIQAPSDFHSNFTRLHIESFNVPTSKVCTQAAQRTGRNQNLCPPNGR